MAERVEFHPEAQQDFDELFEWYATRSDTAAAAFALAVYETVAKIVADPQRFPKTFGGCHTVP